MEQTRSVKIDVGYADVLRLLTLQVGILSSCQALLSSASSLASQFSSKQRQCSSRIITIPMIKRRRKNHEARAASSSAHAPNTSLAFILCGVLVLEQVAGVL